MQTPGKQIQPQTPMIAISRRVDSTLERLSRVEEDVVNIERPQRRIFGSIISQFQTINNSMQNMQELIRDDIRAKKKYYAEETKILQKDSRNLTNLNVSFGRQLAAGALGLYGLSQLRQGNLGEGAAGVGGAAALLTPEILGVITTVVTTKLASSGLLGRGGVGTMGSRVAGASKLKNPLLITAALAASLILPGLIGSNQNADRRRQISASRTIRGQEIINKPDVDRFKSIISRFDAILSAISLDNSRKLKGGIDDEDIDDILKRKEKKDKKDKKELEPEEKDTEIPKEEIEKKGFFEGIKNLFGFGEKEEEKNIESSVEGDTNIESSVERDTNISMIDDSFTEGDVKFGDTTNQIQQGGFASNSLAMNFIEPGDNNSASTNLPNMSIEMMSNEMVNNNIVGSGQPQVIDISDDSESVPGGFTQETATPVFISVGTKFNRSIDKFESAASLRTWGAFS